MSDQSRTKHISTITTAANRLLAGDGERWGEHRPDSSNPRYDSWVVTEAARTHPSADPVNRDSQRTGSYFGRTVLFYPRYSQGGDFQGVSERRNPILDVIDYDRRDGGIVSVTRNRQGVEVVDMFHLERLADGELATLARILGDISTHYAALATVGS